MLGRYSLDVDGLVLAGQSDAVEDYPAKMTDSEYMTFMLDVDNVIPITDVECFVDNDVPRFVEFVHVVYGGETLEENLQFVADALNPAAKGAAHDIIRRRAVIARGSRILATRLPHLRGVRKRHLPRSARRLPIGFRTCGLRGEGASPCRSDNRRRPR